MSRTEVWIELISFVLILCGGILTGIAIYRYYKLLKKYKATSYNKYATKQHQQKFMMVLLYIVAIGDVAALLDILSREVESIYILISIIFLIVGFFVIFSVNHLQEMNGMLNIKTLEVMRALINSIELKDSYTKGHSQHVYDVVHLFYNYLPESYQKKLDLHRLLDAAILHDIGKIAIKDGVLNKEGKLDDEEWRQMKRHPMEAKKLLDSTCFKEVSNWVLYHHERVDGKGYYLLPGSEIPLESKIIAIADTYSALCTDRSYRPGMPHKKAIGIMIDAVGTQLDGRLLESFCRIPEDEIVQLLNTNHVSHARTA